MQHEHRFSKANRVNGAVGSIRIVFENLQYASATESLQYFGCFMLLAELRKVQCVPEELADAYWKSQLILLATPHPDQRSRHNVHDASIPEQVLKNLIFLEILGAL